MSMWRRRFAWLSIGASILLASVAAHATTLARMSLAKMSQTARTIVRARCLANETAWDAGEIWTFTSFQVEETWGGSVPSRIVVRLLGGKVGNLTSTVSGVPRFRPGEEVVLFLEPTAKGDFSVVSWEQGTFRIGRNKLTGEEFVSQDTASIEVFDQTTRSFATTGIRKMPLELFHEEVNATLSPAAGRHP